MEIILKHGESVKIICPDGDTHTFTAKAPYDCGGVFDIKDLESLGVIELIWRHVQAEYFALTPKDMSSGFVYEAISYICDGEFPTAVRTIHKASDLSLQESKDCADYIRNLMYKHGL